MARRDAIMHKPKDSRGALRRMIRFYTLHHLPRSAAGLSYFLTLSFFPTLICLYTMLGRLSPGPEEVRARRKWMGSSWNQQAPFSV